MYLKQIESDIDLQFGKGLFRFESLYYLFFWVSIQRRLMIPHDQRECQTKREKGFQTVHYCSTPNLIIGHLLERYPLDCVLFLLTHGNILRIQRTTLKI